VVPHVVYTSLQVPCKYIAFDFRK